MLLCLQTQNKSVKNHAQGGGWRSLLSLIGERVFGQLEEWGSVYKLGITSSGSKKIKIGNLFMRSSVTSLYLKL